MSKKSRRDLSEYPSLDPAYNTKVRREFKDYDYLDQLSEGEMEWFNKFNEEFYDGTVSNTKGENIHPTHEEMAVHQTPAKKGKEYCPLRQELQKKNNMQNNDLYGVSRAGGLLSEHIIENQEKQQVNRPDMLEDCLIELIDNDKKKG
jgi:hypothetical protein